MLAKSSVVLSSNVNAKAKIDGLKAILPNKNIIRNLHHFRFMGNDAVHELTAPKPGELALTISVIEDLLNFLYPLAPLLWLDPVSMEICEKA